LLRSFLALLVLCCAARAETGLPDGAGKEILETACVKCHDLGRVLRAGYGARDWSTVLHMMKNAGAQISDGQLDTLAAYLAENPGEAESPRRNRLRSGACFVQRMDHPHARIQAA